MEYKNLEQMILENENFKLALNSALHKNDVSGSVLLGDCLELLPLFANKSVDYSFTSPPYNRERNDKYRDFTDINENWLQLNIDVLNQLLRVTKKHSVCLQLCGKVHKAME